MLFKQRNRDVTALTGACEALNIGLSIAENEEQFSHCLDQENPFCIVVPMGSKAEGGDHVREFAQLARKHFEPEHADIGIIYSSEEFTPDRWPGTLDPRSIKSYGGDPVSLAEDKNWVKTIEVIKSINSRVGHPKNSSYHVLNIGFSQEGDVSFPTEAAFLIRAAFKDMSSVVVEFPKQGLSGSITCIVRPINGEGVAVESAFAKIYPEEQKALRDLENFSTHIEALGSEFYPPYDRLRRYHGKGYSILVMSTVMGPSGRQITLRDVICSAPGRKFSVRDVVQTVEMALSAMDNKWAIQQNKDEKELFDVYLRKFAEDKNKALNLECENNCHKWFQDWDEKGGIKEKIVSTVPPNLLVGAMTKVCHGDLHTDNIMIKSDDNGLGPVFIDFSRTELSHSLRDLVTLESDLIIRCLAGIKVFSNKSNVMSLLQSMQYGIGMPKCVNEWTYDADELLQLQKVQAVIQLLRSHALSRYRSSEAEYFFAALLKALEVLSYGKLPPSQNVRATTYVTHCLDRVTRTISST